MYTHNTLSYMYMYTHNIYIYIYREREREREYPLLGLGRVARHLSRCRLKDAAEGYCLKVPQGTPRMLSKRYC